MSQTSQHTNLFNSSGCIKYTALQLYAEKKLNETDCLLIQHHMNTCPLCTDALEGINNVRDHEVLPITFQRINSTLKHRLEKKQKLKLKRYIRNQRQRKLLLYSVAASVLILIGVIKILDYQQKYVEPRLAETNDSLVVTKEANTLLAENIVIRRKSVKSMEKHDTQIVYEKLSPIASQPVKEIEIINDDEIIIDTSEIVTECDWEISITEEDAEESVYFVVETMPSFQGGDAFYFREYISKHLRYPEEALEYGIEGKVLVQFVVNSEGRIDQVHVIRSADPLLDKEAVRAITNSPTWTPGLQRGKPVSVQFTIPIEFRLN